MESSSGPGGAPDDEIGAPAGPELARRKRSTTKTAIEWGVLVVGALVIALLVKAFLFQAFYIPSDSMVPTLKKDDRVIVNKVSYKVHSVHRGDIIVFTTPKGPDGKPIDPTIKDLVKRVIGLPGEIVSEKNDHVYIDGKALSETYLPKGTVSNCASFASSCFRTAPLGTDEYWVMGDNRVGSRDSRGFGPIKKSSIVGRVFIRVWPPNRLGLL
ncbi:MAG TPA: signal peptidase I [Acidimicrobiia bacterium]|nr:signal peptidase I [Acidimicrobiia bacterium]